MCIIIPVGVKVHSLPRMAKKYAGIDEAMLKFFYGDVDVSRNDFNENYMRNITVRAFFENTRTKYTILHCKIGEKDCRRNWSKVITFLGPCLRFDPNHIVGIETHER